MYEGNNLVEEIAKIENDLVLDATKLYGNYYANCIKLFEALRKIKATNDNGFVFNLFWSQLISFCSLHILSLIRKHTVQANLILRSIYETICYTSYAMVETDIKQYGYEDEHGILVPKKKIKDKVYAWLKKEFSNYSEFIQKPKNVLNKLFAHPTLFAAFLHVKAFPEENKFRSLVFDDEDNQYLTEGLLIGFSNQLYHLIIMTIDVNNVYGMLELDESYINEVESLHKETQLLIKEVQLNSQEVRDNLNTDLEN